MEIEIPNNFNEQSGDSSEIFKVSEENFSYDQFFFEFMAKNLPVIVKNMKIKTEISEKWYDDDGNFQIEKLNLPRDKKIPIANCSKQYFDSHQKSTMSFGDFVSHWNQREESSDLLYLKDFHLKQETNMDFYNVPPYFASDFLNEFLIDKDQDDYRFIYCGPKGSW